MAGMTSRQTQLPGPPPPFDPNLGKQLTARATDEAQAEHLRLKPEERFRSPSRPGAPTHTQTLPPAPFTQNIKPLAPALPAHYPAWRYHATKAPAGIMVKDPDHEAAVANPSDGWVRTPAAFPKTAVPEISSADKLELLEDLSAALGEVAEAEDQSPLMTLHRVIAERDMFALKISKMGAAADAEAAAKAPAKK